MKRLVLAAAFAVLVMHGVRSEGAMIDLFQYTFNIDGAISDRGIGGAGDPVPAAADISGFSETTGLGTIVITLGAAGPHYVGLFVDHEIDETTNTFFNEFGSVSGAPVAGQTFEIDEPGFLFGDIPTNFAASALDGTNGVPSLSPDDVSMALAWDFIGPAKITFTLSKTMPSGFFLSQTDPDSPDTIYFSSKLGPLGPPVIPEPASLLMWAALGAGTLGMVAARRRRGVSRS